MRRGSARANARRITVVKRSKLRGRLGKSASLRRAKPSSRGSGHGKARKVRVVRSRPTRARRPARPLPPADAVSERMFISSLERSLRDYRVLWEALAKR